MKLQSYYKKIDRSTFEWGVTIPKNLEKDFLVGKEITLHKSRPIKIFWDRKSYDAILVHSANKQDDYYTIRYTNNRDLLKKLRTTFIQSYVILKSQKELFDSKEKEKQFRSNLTGGQQEVLIFQPIVYF